VNWNAPLAQIANFAADQVAAPAATPSCEVQYVINGQWPGGFNAQILVKNTGDVPLEDVRLTWALPTGQSIVHSWSVELTQQGHVVTATELGGGTPLKAGRTFTFGFIGTKDARTAVAPASVTCSAG
jgi:endoglucanase